MYIKYYCPRTGLYIQCYTYLPPIHDHSEPVNMTLFGKESLCQCNHIKMMSYWISVGPKPNVWYPYKKVLQRCRHAGRPSCEDRGRDWSDIAASQRLPVTLRSQESSSVQVLVWVFGGGMWPWWHWFWTPSLQKQWDINFYCLYQGSPTSWIWMSDDLKWS